MRASDAERKQASQTIQTNSIFSSLNCFPPIHFLREFGQVLTIQLDQQHHAGPGLTRSRCCCLLPKHGEEPGDFKPSGRASYCPTLTITFPLQSPAVLKTSSETQTHPDSAKPLNHISLPPFLSILGLGFQIPFLLYTATASIQTPVPIAGCQEAAFQPDLKALHGPTRAQQSFLSACSNTELRERRGVGLPCKFPFCMIMFPVSIQAGSRLPFVIFKLLHASTIS